MVVKNIPTLNLNETDWKVLRDVIWPFIHAKDPSKVTVSNVPEHLAHHHLMDCIRSKRKSAMKNIWRRQDNV